MKSRTSFFNGTVLRKDITRYAPLWGLYTVFLFVLFLAGQRGDTTLTASAVANTLREMAICNLIYGGLCASILFGDLFQSRMCQGLHAMPLRRESWFCTHALAGLLFCIVPSLAAAVFLMFLLQEFFYIALLWLAVTVLQYLFFFGLGLFSVMCAGNRLGMIAVYLITNLFSLLAYVLAKKVYEPLLYGIEMVSDPFEFFCPVAHLASQHPLSFNYDYINDRFVNGHIERFYPEVWTYLFVVAAIGVLLGFLALLLYRKRKLECAGNFLAFRGLGPVFLMICTLASGVFLFAMSSVFGFTVNYILMAIGIIAGFFAGSMLLERTVRVFHKKSFLRFGALALVLAASLLLAKIDPLGITRYVPETDEIAYMQVYQDTEKHYFGNDYRLETPQQIETFRNVHATLMTEQGAKTDGASHLYVCYKLKSGREVTRYYTIDEHTAAYDTLRMHFSDYRYLFNCNSWEDLTNGAFTGLSLDLYGYETEYTKPAAMELGSIDVNEREMIAQFMEALRKDCDAGNMAQPYTFHVDEHSVGWCYLSTNIRNEQGIITANGERFRDLAIYPSATHVNALIEQWLAEAAIA